MSLFRRRELDTAPFARQPVDTTYAERLAFIGRRLDDGHCRSVVVLEISGNYIIRTIDRSSGEPVLIELVDENFAQGDVRMPIPPHPTSYEMILTVIGRMLDERTAANVAIIEGRSSYRVTGWEHQKTGGQAAYVIFDSTLDRYELQRLTSQER